MCKEEDDVQFKQEEVGGMETQQAKKEENKYKGFPEPGNVPEPPDKLVNLPKHSAGVKEDSLKVKSLQEFHDLDLSDMSNK
ncbi:hypothetical protein TVAG_283110 [Trichomonas vaginalis G3]|uniref:Uncharacterized protein n=1 Tax=Trichomonas vaginalis (strain ATCC PRA-98 / G3) TaxID=412133 RepID=A2DEL4_TRIV3|nr:hypothetical protein TVAGG3_0577700 [Trichomonas vaginalis G3]EAY21141.1 hypothetical protein TVAG_283110 [Trichomonas vaginalis G3]KAI5522334.1 hypothetical protein TVAGG3_0577700 [Trichomonas vaginalis G3]|eukprot:XP_001582127.1 hypothetical protein [Trichomonas vaginalis G3]